MINKSIRRYSLNEFVEVVKSDEKRYELIDGNIHMMASPSVRHYMISKFISDAFETYFKDKKCEVFMGMVDVFLFKKNINKCRNCYVPDLFVVCDKSKIKNRGIYGAPDLVVEVISESTRRNDLITKLNGYMRYGVREYWTVDDKTNSVAVHSNMHDATKYKYDVYSFGDIVKSVIFDLYLDFSKFVSEYGVNYNDTV